MTVVAFQRVAQRAVTGAYTSAINQSVINQSNKRRTFSTSTEQSNCYVWGAANEIFSEASQHRKQRLTPRLFPNPANNQSDQSADPIKSLAVGAHHYAVLTESGTLYTAGQGKYGELGLGKTFAQIDKPRRVQDVPRLVDVKCGVYHTIALTDEGEVMTCGWGGSFFTAGTLGHGDTQTRPALTKIEALSGEKIVAISTGKDHCLCLNDKGEVFAFGRGEFGRLGTAGSGNEKVPVKLSALEGVNVRRIFSGSSFNAAVTTDGSVYTWGRNDAGQLGLGVGLTFDTHSMESVPTRVEFDYESTDGEEEQVNVSEIACGHRHMVALTAEGRVFTWGQRVWMKPVLMRGDDEAFLKNKITHIAAGKNMSAAIRTDGSLFTWGAGRSGQLGNGSTSAVKEPKLNTHFGPTRELGRAINVMCGGADQIAVMTRK